MSRDRRGSWSTSRHRPRRDSISFHLKKGQVWELEDGRHVLIKFIGETEFASGTWVGAQLKKEHDHVGYCDGNDGSIGRKRYFKCPKGRGLFFRMTRLVQEVHDEVKSPKEKFKRRIVERRRSVSDWTPAAWEKEEPANIGFVGNSNRRLIKRKPGPRDVDRSTGSWKPFITPERAWAPKMPKRHGPRNSRAARSGSGIPGIKKSSSAPPPRYQKPPKNPRVKGPSDTLSAYTNTASIRPSSIRSGNSWASKTRQTQNSANKAFSRSLNLPRSAATPEPTIISPETSPGMSEQTYSNVSNSTLEDEEENKMKKPFEDETKNLLRNKMKEMSSSGNSLSSKDILRTSMADAKVMKPKDLLRGVMESHEVKNNVVSPEGTIISTVETTTEPSQSSKDLLRSAMLQSKHSAGSNQAVTPSIEDLGGGDMSGDDQNDIKGEAFNQKNQVFASKKGIDDVVENDDVQSNDYDVKNDENDVNDDGDDVNEDEYDYEDSLPDEEELSGSDAGY